MDMSTTNRFALHAALKAQIRRFIAGAIFSNQKIADQVGLHSTDMQCINLLDLLGPVTPGKLAQYMGLTTGGVTVMLDRLETAGLVAREPNPADRRSVLVTINPRKLRKIQALYAGIDERVHEFFSKTPEAELQIVLNFLTKINAMRIE